MSNRIRRLTYTTLVKLFLGSLLCVGFTAITAHTRVGLPQAEAGKEIFVKNCVRCHGDDGTKGKFGAKNLRDSKLTNEAVINIISNGRSIMPAWKKRLSPGEIQKVAAYITQLRK